jgi:mRNA-degrading endonuclease RelE of RelBE toxin-antitoxin system
VLTCLPRKQRAGESACIREDLYLKTKGLYRGSKKSIAVLLDGEDDVDGFISSLPASDRRKLDVLFERMGEFGVIHNREKFKKLEGSDGVFEFKSFQIRLLCFFVSDRVIICRGLFKKKDKHDKIDITYAEACRKKCIGE